MKQLLFALGMVVLYSCSRKKEDVVTPGTLFTKLQTNTTKTLTDISFINDNEGIICGEFGFCAKTSNGANTWTELNTGAPFSFVSAYMYDNQNYYIGRNGIYKTSDGGNSFDEIGNLGQVAAIIPKIYFQDLNTGFIAKSAGIYKSTDGGQSWTEKYNTGVYYGINNLQFTSQNIGYASGGRTFDQTNEGEIVKTIDGGESWSKILSTINVTSINFITDNIGFYSNFNKELFKTTDGGTSWNKIATLNYLPLCIVFKNESVGYITTQEGKLLATSDGAQTWSTVYEDSGPITKIIKTPNAYYAVGGNGLLLKSK